MQPIQSYISITLRKKSGAVTTANVRDNSFVDSLVQQDYGFHILKGLRSAPAHWEAEKKKVITMIRQFGLPTFFITLSAAESKRTELLVTLSLLLDSRHITEQLVDAVRERDIFEVKASHSMGAGEDTPRAHSTIQPSCLTSVVQ